MVQPVVVVAKSDENPSSDFAAGVAAATAVEAAQTAGEAEAKAEAAQASAEVAAHVAGEAASTAAAADVRTYTLGDRIDRLEAIVDDLADAITAPADEPAADPTMPPKVTVSVEPPVAENGDDDQADKPKRRTPRKRTLGAPKWFNR
jgi:hypothetical protein